MGEASNVAGGGGGAFMEAHQVKAAFGGVGRLGFRDQGRSCIDGLKQLDVGACVGSVLSAVELGRAFHSYIETQRRGLLL